MSFFKSATRRLIPVVDGLECRLSMSEVIEPRAALAHTLAAVIVTPRSAAPAVVRCGTGTGTIIITRSQNNPQPRQVVFAGSDPKAAVV